MAKNRDTQDVRRANLKALIAQWGGPTSLAKKLGFSGPSYLSQMVSGLRPITEKCAHKTEAALELPHGWMSSAHDEKPQPARVDNQKMADVIKLIGASLEEAGINISPSKFADLVVMVYEKALQSGEPDEAFIKQLIKLLR